MTTQAPPRRSRRGTAVAVVLAAALALVGCASMPTSGGVVEGTAEVAAPGEVGFDVQGPASGADPMQLVQGFVNVAQLGPASTSTFNVAREYVTPAAWNAWDRASRVLVLSEYPEWEVAAYEEDATTTTVSGEAMVVATLDEAGVYSELPEPSPVDVSYELSRDGGEWRMSGLDDGLLVLQTLFGYAFHRTTLYYPTPDRRWWVPDVRWYPEQAWRTTASQQILAGPPPPLVQSAISVVPEGTALAIDAVTVDDEGVIDVSVTSAITSAPADDRALLVAQLEETLREGEGRSVELSEGSSPLAVEAATETPSHPVTLGDAVAVLEGDDGEPALRRVVGTELTDLEQPVRLGDLTPTGVGVGPDDGPVVVRAGDDRLFRLSADAPPALLLRGDDLLAPSVDRFGTVWTAVDGRTWVALESGESFALDVEWLADAQVRSLRVSPEGARIAVVADGADGPEVWVAAVERDADDVPTGLSVPVRVGAPVPSVAAVDWYEETTLVLLGRNPDGTRSPYLAGIGGLAGSAGGASRALVTPSGPQALASGVGASPLLVLDSGGVLSVRQSSALWPSVATGVRAAAYPG
ncbi:LpqB family beta-propeller domain-containing protein [Isoptericola chiayiensis]|uniref:LpqB family beta-propeller domain-containing protein n=1 Tax=Isoptericola chiayiensis TaxID=579446 RepID=A0ABP8Y539_9MICO|nr:LpqB family beta-propeller domain-containing protein [Isoptericola chiayiensis]NOV99281.1 hypothetical protein [Isoptericola chiayiensis]